MSCTSPSVPQVVFLREQLDFNWKAQERKQIKIDAQEVIQARPVDPPFSVARAPPRASLRRQDMTLTWINMYFKLDVVTPRDLTARISELCSEWRSARLHAKELNATMTALHFCSCRSLEGELFYHHSDHDGCHLSKESPMASGGCHKQERRNLALFCSFAVRWTGTWRTCGRGILKSWAKHRVKSDLPGR